MEIRKRFRFEAAHRLPHVPEGHKCGRLHGHSYSFWVVVHGPITPQGWVMDFGTLKRTVKPIVDRLDHSYLNEINGLENPTSEVLAEWLFQKMDVEFGNLLAGIEVSETCETQATYWRGDGERV